MYRPHVTYLTYIIIDSITGFQHHPDTRRLVFSLIRRPKSLELGIKA